MDGKEGKCEKDLNEVDPWRDKKEQEVGPTTWLSVGLFVYICKASKV